MPFDSETAKLAGQKSKRGPAKVNQDLRDAFETICQLGIMKLYERMDELNPSQLLKLVQITSSYVLPKTKPQVDRVTQAYKDHTEIQWGETFTDLIEKQKSNKS